MAQDDVLIKYDVDLSGLKAAQVEVGKVTDLTKDLGTEVKKTFSENAIDDANEKLTVHGAAVQEATKQYTSLGAKLKDLKNQINTSTDPAAIARLTKEAAKTQHQIEETGKSIRKLSSDTRSIDAVVKAASGIAAAMSVAQGAAALFGGENKNLEKSILKVQAAMAILSGVQEIARQVNEKNTLAAKAYEFTLGLVEKAQKAMAASSVAAFGIIGVAIAAVIGVVMALKSAFENSTSNYENKIKEIDKAWNSVNETLQNQKTILESLGRNTIQVDIEIEKNNLAKAEQELQAFKNKIEQDKQNKLKIQGMLSDEDVAKIQEDEAKIAAFEARVTALKQKARKQRLGILAQDRREQIDMMATGDEKEIGDMKLTEKKELAQLAEERREKREALELQLQDSQIAKAKQEEILLRFDQGTNKKLLDIQAKYIAERRKAHDKAVIDEANRLADLQIETQKQLREARIALPALDNGPIQKLEIPVEVKLKFDQVKVKEDIEALVTNFFNELSESLKKIQPIASGFQDLTNSLFAAETQKLQDEKDEQLSILEISERKQLALVGENSEKRRIIEEAYQKKKERLEKIAAIKAAQLQRDQAIANKTFAIFNVVIDIAQGIAKTIADNGFPKAIPLIALAAASGALQIAAIAAQPLPTIPKFEEGGAVALFGGEIRGGMVHGRSHREGGVLIEAEGNEFINRGASVAKYGTDIFEAANELRLEPFLYHKYIAPALRAAQVANQNEYDDGLLRKTIRDSEERNAKYIADKVSAAINNNTYVKNRYN